MLSCLNRAKYGDLKYLRNLFENKQNKYVRERKLIFLFIYLYIFIMYINTNIRVFLLHVAITLTHYSLI